MTFVQETSFPDGRAEIWYETAMLPGMLRIDITPLDSLRAQVFRADSIFGWRNGQLRMRRPFVHSLMVLGPDIHARPAVESIKRITDLGFDLSKIREDRFSNRAVWVVGAVAGDTTSNQFWVDRENLLFARIIEKPPAPNGVVTETVFLKHDQIGGAWTESDVSFRRGGIEIQRERYTTIKINVPVDPAVFGTAAWKRPDWIVQKP